MNNIRRRLVIGWKVSTLAPQIASVRYRAFLPVLALEEHGVECQVFSNQHSIELDELDALVIVKGLSLQDCELVQKAFSKQIPIVLDLCDNIFVSEYGQSVIQYRPTPADTFAIMARYASAIVVSTEPLAELVRLHCGHQRQIFVIPDGAESSFHFEKINAKLKSARHMQHRRIIRSLTRSLLRSMHRLQDFGWMAWGPVIKHCHRIVERGSAKWVGPALFWRGPFFSRSSSQAASNNSMQPFGPPPESAPLQIIWFGIHGGEHANFGMLDLLLIQADLEQIAREFNVELVVISNNRGKFERHIQPLKIRTRYLDWTPSVMEQQFQTAALTIIPNSLESFSVCKSANRAVLSLSAGVPVVATLTPALKSLSECIRTDSPLDGMRYYLSDATRAAQDVQQGRAHIQQAFGSNRISSLWLDALQTAKQSGTVSADAALVIAVHLIMDIDLALPVIRKAQDMGIGVMVLCNSEIRTAKPDMEALLRQHCRQYMFLHTTMLDRSFLFPASAAALLTFSETNLHPHAFNRQLTRMANRAGLATYTAQHGFENVGLTYDDAVQPVREISFAAQHVFTWGKLETLHPSIPASTRRKCRPVGCPKPAQGARIALPDTFSSGTPVVGVFENLHWRRYSDEYRKSFINHVIELTEQHRDILFLIKPHNAGLWLTHRFQGKRPSASNIVIADPQSPQWASTTASGLFWRCMAVITTPSTVALDAARHGLPVAVVAENLALDNYAPLPLLRHSQDWLSFVASVLEPHERLKLLDLAQDFCQRVVLPGGADSRMIEAMLPQYAENGHSHARPNYAPAC